MKWGLQDKEIRSGIKGNHFIRYIKSFGNALNGILYAIRFEHNFIIIISAIIVTTILGILFNISMLEWCFVIICYGLVFGCELINSALEATVDLVTLERKPLAKIAKDCASGATLIFSIMSLIIGLLIFIPRIK